jgi:hypothetical protein
MDKYSVVSNVDIGGATTGTEAQAGPNPFDRGLDWGAAPWDIRHNYHFNLVYRVPDAGRQAQLSVRLSF